MVEPGKSYCLVGGGVDIFSEPVLAEALSKIAKIDIIQENAANLGVDEVRKLVSQANTKPFGEYRLLVIKNIHLLSEVCQNTLLKILEEPPSYLYIFLSAENLQNILPTIISRITTIRVAGEKNAETDDKFLSDYEYSENVLASATREEAAIKLKSKLEQMKKMTLYNPSSENVSRLNFLEKTIDHLRKNMNQKLAINLLLLNWFEK